MHRKCFFILLLTFVGMLCRAQLIVLKPHDPRIHYMGRVIMQDDAAQLLWPSTSLKINFKGTGVKAILKDEHGSNYFNVIVDDNVVAVIHPDSVQKEYTLVSGLNDGNHSLELFKRTEWAQGKTWFYQFSFDKNSQPLNSPPAKKRKMEFFGNSITCGVAVEDSSGKDDPDARYTNSYLSYAAITARHFDAEFNNTSQGGVGLMVSWIPIIMPEMYNLFDPPDFQNIWDFSKYTPDVVVINILQNDSWLVKLPGNDQFKARFGKNPPTEDQIIRAYRNFVKNIHNTYPKAQIICTLGCMDATKQGSPWPGYIEKAVAQLSDKNVYSFFFPYKNASGHPNVKEQQAMADGLVGFIDQHIKW